MSRKKGGFALYIDRAYFPISLIPFPWIVVVVLVAVLAAVATVE